MENTATQGRWLALAGAIAAWSTLAMVGVSRATQPFHALEWLLIAALSFAGWWLVIAGLGEEAESPADHAEAPLI